MTRFSAFLVAAGLLATAACDGSHGTSPLAPAGSSLSRSSPPPPVPAPVAGPALGASRIATYSRLLGGRVALLDDPFGTLVGNAYEFNASRDATGHAAGTFDFIARYGRSSVHLRGVVVCYTVSGTTARVGGVVTSSDFSQIPVGTSETWSFTDNGAPASGRFDTASSFLGGNADYALGYCANGLPYTERPVITGSMQIVP